MELLAQEEMTPLRPRWTVATMDGKSLRLICLRKHALNPKSTLISLLILSVMIKIMRSALSTGAILTAKLTSQEALQDQSKFAATKQMETLT